MQIGVTFPQTEIGANPTAIRDYAQAVEGLGYAHILAYDHVLGADTTHRPDWKGAYSSKDMFHEVFVLFGYLAALTRMELVTGILILPQRQTALVAKQAAEIDVLTGGKLRLGVAIGWNAVEYEALGMNFRTRGRAIEEEVEVLRLLWSKDIVDYKGTFVTIPEAGLNPLPPRRSIPIWMGGSGDKLLRRIARLGDGWFPQGLPDEHMRQTLERLRGYIRDAGRDPASVGIEARIEARDGAPDDWARRTEDWRKLGATHISINTLNAGYKSLDEHIQAIRRYKEALGS